LIHHVLLHTQRAGFTRAAIPMATTDGRTFVAHDAHLWELSRWIPGRADYLDSPSRRKLAAAMSSLAEFHVCAQSALGATRLDYSPGIERRGRQLERLPKGEQHELRRAVGNSVGELADRCHRLLDSVAQHAPAVCALLQPERRRRVTLQPCIRDIWHDHVLFVGEDVSGFVDFGAISVDTVAGDIARLLASLAECDLAAWQHGTEAYQKVRGLSDVELELVRVFDRANTLLSGVNWMRWLFVEGRRFEEPLNVAARLDALLRRLEA
jgi:homoserine kinase type II